MDGGLVIGIIVAVILVIIIIWLINRSSQPKPPVPAGTRFNVALSPGNEVPPVTSVANGSGTALLSQDGSSLSYNINVNSPAPIVDGGFYLGPAGMVGSRIKTLQFSPTARPGAWLASGVWSATDATEPLTPDLVAALKSGQVYVNALTTVNPTGEVRGQLSPLLR